MNVEDYESRMAHLKYNLTYPKEGHEVSESNMPSSSMKLKNTSTAHTFNI
jgi:hypothetical protein